MVEQFPRSLQNRRRCCCRVSKAAGSSLPAPGRRDSGIHGISHRKRWDRHGITDGISLGIWHGTLGLSPLEAGIMPKKAKRDSNHPNLRIARRPEALAWAPIIYAVSCRNYEATYCKRISNSAFHSSFLWAAAVRRCRSRHLERPSHGSRDEA